MVIVSSDKDMLQLVNDRVRMLNPMKDDMWLRRRGDRKVHGRASRRRWPICWRSRATRSTIFPGAPGIGEKGAKDLIVRFGSVENALEHAAEVERKTYRESLQNNRDQILLSKRLATIHCDVPIELELETLVDAGAGCRRAARAL